MAGCVRWSSSVAKAGQLERAQAAANDVEQAARTLTGPPSQAQALTNLATALAQDG